MCDAARWALGVGRHMWVWGAGCRVQGVGCRVDGLRLRTQALAPVFGTEDGERGIFEQQVQAVQVPVPHLFRVLPSGFRVWVCSSGFGLV